MAGFTRGRPGIGSHLILDLAGATAVPLPVVNINPDWQNAHVYAAGAIITPASFVASNPLGLSFFTLAGGTSGAARPVFNQVLGGSTTDNTVTWLTIPTPPSPASQTGINFAGTKWPLLPNTSYKFYNAYLNIAASASQSIKISSMLVGILFTDNAGNLVGKLGIASANMSDPTWAQGINGSFLVASGDPLTEFYSNLLVTGATPGATPFGTMAFFQIFYAADVLNATNGALTANGNGSCLFSALPRI